MERRHCNRNQGVGLLHQEMMTIIAIFYTPLIKWALRPRNNDSFVILRHVGGRGGYWLSIMHRHVIPRSESTEISSIYPRYVIGERWNLQFFGCVNFCLVNLYVGPKRGHKKIMRFTPLESLLSMVNQSMTADSTTKPTKAKTVQT